MRSLRSPVVLGLALLAGMLPDAGRAEFSLFRNSWGDVIVATDTTLQGKALTPPTPAQPVYYRGRSLGRRLGSIPGDEEPGDAEMKQFVTQVLAQQGYLGATPGVNEPTLYIIIQWGYLRPESGDLLWFLGYDPSQDIGSAVFPAIIGPEIYRTGFRSRTVQTILEDAGAAIYGIIITAFEYKSAATPAPVICWQTRIGLPANGKSMAQALPAMLIAAGPAIGRESDSPVLLNADSARAGSVKLGELKFFDEPGESTRAK